MMPTREQAHVLLQEGLIHNPGPWGDHSRVAAHCAEAIAAVCPDLDSEKAYVLGLLHDIGRTFGTRHLGHVIDGYHYMMKLGYPEVARVCMTHSFHKFHSTDGYIGKFDVTPEEMEEIKKVLEKIEPNQYDYLIQLCDAMAGSDQVLDIEERMEDVKRRYGSYPPDKWENTQNLLSYFEQKTGKNLYDLVDKEHFRP